MQISLSDVFFLVAVISLARAAPMPTAHPAGSSHALFASQCGHEALPGAGHSHQREAADTSIVTRTISPLYEVVWRAQNLGEVARDGMDEGTTGVLQNEGQEAESRMLTTQTFPGAAEQYSAASELAPLPDLSHLASTSNPLPLSAKEARQLERKRKKKEYQKAYRARVRIDPSKAAVKAKMAASAEKRWRRDLENRKTKKREKYRLAKAAKGLAVRKWSRGTGPSFPASQAQSSLDASLGTHWTSGPIAGPTPSQDTSAGASHLRSSTEQGMVDTVDSPPDDAWFDNILKTPIDPELFKDLPLE